MDPRITPEMILNARERAKILNGIVSDAASTLIGPNFTPILILVDETKKPVDMAIITESDSTELLVEYLNGAIQRITNPMPGQVVDASSTDD